MADTNMNERKINIFKIGDLWCFKYFFSGGEMFSKLNKYYDKSKYRFEVKTLNDLKKVMEYLEYGGFDVTLIKDSSIYTVRISKYNKYKPILKNSIESYERGRDRIFIMKDLTSVNDAIKEGATKCSFSSNSSPRGANSDKYIQIKYLGTDQSHFYTCEWIFYFSDVGRRMFFDVKSLTNRNVHLRKTAKIWVKEKDSAKTKYSLRISGIGEDERCAWCRYFFTALRGKANEEGIFVDEDWECPFEGPVHPKDRYASNINELLRRYR
ncbi:MAG: hypothetical protein N2V72_05445 [Methanophagales archaeon]|nr:hypothetical protein [Methanophagales archaeon]